MLLVACMFDDMLRHGTICVCRSAASAVSFLIDAEDKMIYVTSAGMYELRMKPNFDTAATDSTHNASGSQVLYQRMV